MIALLRIAIVGLTIQLFATQGRAQSVVFFNDAAIKTSSSGPYLTLTNSVNPSQGRYGNFSILITPLGGLTFSFQYYGVAEVFALYAVTSGTVIDPAFAASTPPLVSNNGVGPASSVQTFPLGQPRLFGYWDARFPSPSNKTPDIDDHYGWVWLAPSSLTELRVSASATVIGGGIIAGTTTPVPEPSSVILLMAGAGLLLWRRIKRQPAATS